MSSELRQYVVLVAIGTLIVIALGAYVTSEALVSQPAAGNVLHAPVHRFAAIVVGFLALVLMVWQWLAKERTNLGYTALGLYVFDGWLGLLGRPVLHASLAPVAFAALVAIVVVTSPSWNGGPELVDDRAAPLLRPLALSALLAGAATNRARCGVPSQSDRRDAAPGRRDDRSLATLVAAMLAMQQYPKHRELRSAAVWMMSIVLTQVVLGVTAFTMQLLELGNSAALVIVTASHVVVGSLTLAASLVLAMQVQRNVRPVPAASSRAHRSSVTTSAERAAVPPA